MGWYVGIIGNALGWILTLFSLFGVIYTDIVISKIFFVIIAVLSCPVVEKIMFKHKNKKWKYYVCCFLVSFVLFGLVLFFSFDKFIYSEKDVLRTAFNEVRVKNSEYSEIVIMSHSILDENRTDTGEKIRINLKCRLKNQSSEKKVLYDCVVSYIYSTDRYVVEKVKNVILN